jgi:hypothetical protein
MWSDLRAANVPQTFADVLRTSGLNEGRKQLALFTRIARSISCDRR